MKKKIWLILIILVIGVIICIPLLHRHSFSEWTILDHSNCTIYGRQERICWCGKKEILMEHIEVIDPAVEVSCTKWGATEEIYCQHCDEIIKEREFLEPIGHVYIDEKCTKCNSAQIDFTDISLYHSHTGENYLKTLENGDSMLKYYYEIEAVAIDFHNNIKRNATYYTRDEGETLYKVAEINFTKYGLTSLEARIVYFLFRNDHPVFYWLHYTCWYNYSTLTIITAEEYAKGVERNKYNEMMYKGIEEYVALTDAETSPYNIALIYYEAIAKNNKYANDSKGEPESALWAHSVIGAFSHGEFVCEGYAQLYQLLLNVNSVENIYILGDTEEEHHAWNMVRMDDGNWYWVDVTWGDDSPYSYSYDYFCVLDEDMLSHEAADTEMYNLRFNPYLPECSKKKFQSDSVLEIDEMISIHGVKYMFTSYGKLFSWRGSQNRIVYDGVVYFCED